MNDLIQQLLPALLSLVGIIAMAAIGSISMKLNKKFAVEIEQGKKVIESFDREALHKAMETAAALVKGKDLIGQKAIDFMLDYVFKSTPDAVKGLAPSAKVLADIAQAKLAAAPIMITGTEILGTLEDAADEVAAKKPKA